MENFTEFVEGNMKFVYIKGLGNIFMGYVEQNEDVTEEYERLHGYCNDEDRH